MSYRGFGLTLSPSGSATLSKTSSPLIQRTPLIASRGSLAKPVVTVKKPAGDPLAGGYEQRDGVWYIPADARSVLYGLMTYMQWIPATPKAGMLAEASATAISPGMVIGDANEKLQSTLSGTRGLVLVDRPMSASSHIWFYFPQDIAAAWPLVYGPNATRAVLDGSPEALVALASVAKTQSGKGGGTPAPGTCPSGSVLVDGACVAVERPSLCPTPPGGVPCPEPAVWDSVNCECVLPQDKGGDKGLVAAVSETPKWVIPVVAGVGAVALIAVLVATRK